MARREDDLIDRLETVSKELADMFGALKKLESDSGLSEEEIRIIITSFSRCLRDIKTMLAMREINRKGRVK